MIQPGRIAQNVTHLLENLIADDLDELRTELVQRLDAPDVSLVSFAEAAVSFWEKFLTVDRIFICDMRDGKVVAGWNKGKNIVNLQDWDEDYRPLDDDEILQKALEGEEMVAAPIEGQGADLAFSLPLDDGRVWLVVFDDTTQARQFSTLDMARIQLVRDLLVIKSRLQLALENR